MQFKSEDADPAYWDFRCKSGLSVHEDGRVKGACYCWVVAKENMCTIGSDVFDEVGVTR